MNKFISDFLSLKKMVNLTNKKSVLAIHQKQISSLSDINSASLNTISVMKKILIDDNNDISVLHFFKHGIPDEYAKNLSGFPCFFGYKDSSPFDIPQYYINGVIKESKNAME